MLPWKAYNLLCSCEFLLFVFLTENNSHGTDSTNYRDKYKTLKRKLKFLLYSREDYFDKTSSIVIAKKVKSKSKIDFFNMKMWTSHLQVLMAENPQPANRPKKTQAVNHTIPPDSLGLFPYHSSDGASSAGGETVPTPNKKSSIQCKYVNNGNQCQERISKRSKSGYCSAHRSVIRISKQESSARPASHVPQATAELPQEMFNVDDEDDRESDNEDSPGSSNFHGNKYDGDDDLVIDWQE
ncbi:hypothetical protein P5673_014682 [Acropora cervicornis]|uniref:Uncharacterized protein n=1 Tax=Acropora cervicornis TaxID=6130 RepID=A0AAD9QJM5_ACRCE|nr:hypothetical protein P5673_014682 [Acropora cervicornis]